MLLMKTLPILIGFSAFQMRVASINNDRELYELDPKWTLTSTALLSQGHNFHKLIISTFQKYYIRGDGEKISVLW